MPLKFGAEEITGVGQVSISDRNARLRAVERGGVQLSRRVVYEPSEGRLC